MIAMSTSLGVGADTCDSTRGKALSWIEPLRHKTVYAEHQHSYIATFIHINMQAIPWLF